MFMSKFKTEHKFNTSAVSLGLPTNFMLGKAVRTFENLKKSLPSRVGV